MSELDGATLSQKITNMLRVLPQDRDHPFRLLWWVKHDAESIELIAAQPRWMVVAHHDVTNYIPDHDGGIFLAPAEARRMASIIRHDAAQCLKGHREELVVETAAGATHRFPADVRGLPYTREMEIMIQSHGRCVALLDFGSLAEAISSVRRKIVRLAARDGELRIGGKPVATMNAFARCCVRVERQLISDVVTWLARTTAPDAPVWLLAAERESRRQARMLIRTPSWDVHLVALSVGR